MQPSCQQPTFSNSLDRTSIAFIASIDAAQVEDGFLSPRKSDQESILAFLNKRPTSEAGPSGRSVHTHEAPSPLKESPKKKRYGPKNWTPTTPPGLSPFKRNGKNAAIICWTPGNSN